MQFFKTLAAIMILLAAPAAMAQGANIALGTSSFDSSLPVEISADELRVDQSTGAAVFDGNVLVVQGEIRITAGRITVNYQTDENGATTGISELLADGGVTMVTGTDAAEAQEAVYAVASGNVTLIGDVLLTQGPSAISGEKLVMDLNTGNGVMEGRVRTVINAGGGDN